jgi:hypothetical protein
MFPGMEYALYIKESKNYCNCKNHCEEVTKMKQADLDTISEIVARYGYSEWSLVGFTATGDYSIFSYFTDPSILPAFKIILISMLKTVGEYVDRCQGDYDRNVHHAGTC